VRTILRSSLLFGIAISVAGTTAEANDEALLSQSSEIAQVVPASLRPPPSGPQSQPAEISNALPEEPVVQTKPSQNGKGPEASVLSKSNGEDALKKWAESQDSATRSVSPKLRGKSPDEIDALMDAAGKVFKSFKDKTEELANSGDKKSLPELKRLQLGLRTLIEVVPEVISAARAAANDPELNPEIVQPVQTTRSPADLLIEVASRNLAALERRSPEKAAVARAMIDDVRWFFFQERIQMASSPQIITEEVTQDEH
jgi:hypothetical protein